MSKQQELLDKIYDDFTQEVVDLEIAASASAVDVVGQLTRALKRVVNNHGATVITIEGKKLTQKQFTEATESGEVEHAS